MSIRIIGIDLAVSAKHTAAIYDPASNTHLTKRFQFRSRAADIERLLSRARQNAPEDLALIAVLEATGMSWFEVGQYLHRQGVQVHRVNGRRTKDLRRVGWPNARSDKLDSITLSRLPVASPRALDPWFPVTGEQMTLQRLCRELSRITEQKTAIILRLQSYDQWAWGGLKRVIPAVALDWMRQTWYDPWLVQAAGEDMLRGIVAAAFPETRFRSDWIPVWLQRAQEMIRLYGSPESIDYARLSEQHERGIKSFSQLDEAKSRLLHGEIIPLYRNLYPDCPLTSIQGIGEASAATYRGFIMDINRFPNGNAFAQWTGMVPKSSQSGDARSKHMPLTKNGPDLIKATLYRNAEVARQWDVQLANIYHTQMVSHGKAHSQAVCAVASHLARRIYAVLRDNRPFVLRDTKERPISKKKSRELVLKHYQVPESIRRERRKRNRVDDASA
jgi:transposase